MEEKTKNSSQNTLLLIIAILLALIVLGGTGFGFYWLGTKKQNSPKSSNSNASAGVTTPDANGNASGDNASSSSSTKVQDLLNSLKGTSGTFDPSKIESSLTGLLGQSNTTVATTLTLVPESQVKKNNQSGSAAMKTYLDTVEQIIASNQTTTLSENVIGQIFSGDLSALDREIDKNKLILTKLTDVGTPNEAVTIQRKYLTLFAASVNVIQGEKNMLSSGSVDYQVIGDSQGLVTLSKEIDSDVAQLKTQFGL